MRVWESHADSDVRQAGKPGPDPTFPTYMVSGSDREMDDLQVAAVTNPQSTPGSVGDLASEILAGTAVAAPVPRPEPPTMEQLLQHLLVGAPAEEVTAGVTELANAGILFPADPAGTDC